MATSGTYAWNLDIVEIIDEAYELAGWEARTGGDLETARRSLNLLLTEWTTKGINLWTIEEDSFDIVEGTEQYNLGSETLDVLQVVQRDSNGIDTPLSRISLEEYMNLPDKSTQGGITQYAVRRGTSQPVMYLYMSPNDDTVDIVYWKIRYLQDVDGFTDTVDAPRRMLPALTFGLAYLLALKKPSTAVSDDAAKAEAQRAANLKQLYDEYFSNAIAEDRDRASVYLRPARRR